MNYSFEYIDILLLAMIAGLFLRLREFRKRTGFEGKSTHQFQEVLKNIEKSQKIKERQSFDEVAQKEFLSGAKIAYDITDFGDSDNRINKEQAPIKQTNTRSI